MNDDEKKVVHLYWLTEGRLGVIVAVLALIGAVFGGIVLLNIKDSSAQEAEETSTEAALEAEASQTQDAIDEESVGVAEESENETAEVEATQQLMIFPLTSDNNCLSADYWSLVEGDLRGPDESNCLPSDVLKDRRFFFSVEDSTLQILSDDSVTYNSLLSHAIIASFDSPIEQVTMNVHFKDMQADGRDLEPVLIIGIQEGVEQDSRYFEIRCRRQVTGEIVYMHLIRPGSDELIGGTEGCIEKEDRENELLRLGFEDQGSEIQIHTNGVPLTSDKLPGGPLNEFASFDTLTIGYELSGDAQMNVIISDLKVTLHP